MGTDRRTESACLGAQYGPAIAFTLTARVVRQALEGLFVHWILGVPVPGTSVPPMILRFMIRVFGGVGLLYAFFLVDLF